MKTQSCRLHHLNGESFQSLRQVISCCFTPRNYFSLSESDGGLISHSNRVHNPRNCSQEGSRTASRFAIQVYRHSCYTAAGTEAEQIHVSQSRSTETVEVTAASCEANSLRTSRARAEETAGEAAARREEDQHQTAAARDGERLDPVDHAGAFTHNCRDICLVH